MPAQGQNIIELGFDVASLDAQKKQILDILLQVYDAGKKIDGTQLKPISLPGFSDLKTQTDAQKKAVDELSLSVKEYSSIQNQRAQTDAKVAAAGSDAAKQLAEQKVQLQQVNKENKDAALAALGLTGAYKELSNQFRQASQEAKNLAAQAIIDPKFSEQAKQAAAVANELNNKLKTIDSGVGDFKRNVGNYTGAITILEKSFNDIKQKLDQMNAAGQQNSAEFQSLTKQYGLLEVVVNQNAKGFSSFQQEIRTNGRALQTLSEQGLQNTEVFRNLQATVANAKREFTEFAQSQKILESQAPILTSLTVAAKGLAGAYAIGTGAVTLFGDGNEKVEKELNQLVAVMTILQGLEEAHQLLEKKGAIVTAFRAAGQKLYNFVLTGSTTGIVSNSVATQAQTVVAAENSVAVETQATAAETLVGANEAAAASEETLTVATTEVAVATTAASGAMAALRFALIATGIGALLILLPSIANAMGLFSDKAKEAAESEKALNDAAKDLNETLINQSKFIADSYNEDYKQIEALIAIKQKQGASEKEIAVLKKQAANIQKQSALDQLDNLGLTYGKIRDFESQLEALNNKKARFQEVYIQILKTGTEAQKEQAKTNIDGIQSQIDAIKGLYEEGVKLRDQIIDSNNAINEADTPSKKDNKNELEAIYQLARIREQAEADSYKRIADDQSASLGDRLNALSKYYELQADMISKAANHEILINKATSSQIKAIRAQQQVDLAKNNQAAFDASSQLTHDSIKKFGDEQKKETERQKAAKLAAETDLQNKTILLGDITNDKFKKNQEEQLKNEKEVAAKKLEIEKDLIQKKEELQGKEIELGQELVDVTQTLVDAGYEKQKNAIQSIIDANNERYSKEITNIQNSTLSEQDKANQTTVLNAQHAAQTEQLEKQQRDINVKKARFDKVVQGHQ
jgi:hypothetical protein